MEIKPSISLHLSVTQILEEPICSAQLYSHLQELFTTSRLSSSSVKSPADEGNASVPSGPSQEARRSMIIDHFARSSVSAEVLPDGELISIYNGAVIITPPYLPSCCQSSNIVVLQRVQAILNRLEIT